MVSGTTITHIFHLQEMDISLIQLNQITSMENIIWMITITSIYLGGLLIVFFNKTLSANFFLSISPLLCAFNIPYLFAIGYGLLTVIIPQTILNLGGYLNFVINWGIVFLCNFIGVLTFELIYHVITSFDSEWSLYAYFAT